MATYRHFYLFEAGKTGWQEIWYRVSGDSLDVAHLKFLNTIALRQACCGNAVQIIAGKTQVVDTPRLGLINPGPGAAPPIAAANRDATWVDAMFRFRDPSGIYRRPVNLRGLSDAVFALGPDGAGADPLVSVQLQAWFRAINNSQQGLGLSFRALLRQGSNTATVVTNAAFVPPNVYLTITSPGHNQSAGTFCTISGLQGSGISLAAPSKKTINGIWRVLDVVDGNNFLINITTSQLTTTPVLIKQGKVRRRDFTYPVIAGVDFVRFTRRATGRAFFVPAGHRSALRQR